MCLSKCIFSAYFKIFDFGGSLNFQNNVITQISLIYSVLIFFLKVILLPICCELIYFNEFLLVVGGMGSSVYTFHKNKYTFDLQNHFDNDYIQRDYSVSKM